MKSFCKVIASKTSLDPVAMRDLANLPFARFGDDDVIWLASSVEDTEILRLVQLLKSEGVFQKFSVIDRNMWIENDPFWRVPYDPKDPIFDNLVSKLIYNLSHPHMQAKIKWDAYAVLKDGVIELILARFGNGESFPGAQDMAMSLNMPTLTAEQLIQIVKGQGRELARPFAASMLFPEIPDGGDWLTAKNTIVRKMADQVPLEVDDRRPKLTRADRLHYFHQNRYALNAEGREALDKMMASPEDETLLKRLLPSQDSPHLDYYLPMNPHDVANIFANLGSLHVTEGCFRGCQHCFTNPSGNVHAMPYYRILELASKWRHADKSTLSQPLFFQLCLHYDTESFDYYDPVYDADIGDIVRELYRFVPELRLSITTRGWYRGDQIGPRAAAKIKTAGRLGYDMRLRVSLDLYDIRKDVDRYMLRMVEVLNAFKGMDVVIVTSIDDSNVEATLQAQNFIRLAASETNTIFDDAFYAGWVSPSGRASGIVSRSKHDPGNCMPGYHILPNGRLRYNHAEMRIFDTVGVCGYRDTSEKHHHFEDVDLRLWDENEAIPLRPLFPNRIKAEVTAQ